MWSSFSSFRASLSLCRCPRHSVRDASDPFACLLRRLMLAGGALARGLFLVFLHPYVLIPVLVSSARVRSRCLRSPSCAPSCLSSLPYVLIAARSSRCASSSSVRSPDLLAWLRSRWSSYVCFFSPLPPSASFLSVVFPILIFSPAPFFLAGGSGRAARRVFSGPKSCALVFSSLLVLPSEESFLH